MLNEDIKKYIRIHANKESPNECCGLIIDTKDSDIFCISCKNMSETPETSFVIDNNEIYKYGMDNIIGFYHSHKNNEEFSLADIAFSERSKKNCILYCIDSNLFKEYEPKNLEIPYENRPFFIGVLDCFTLFQDYYHRELNLTFSTIQHPERYNFKIWSTPETWEKYGYVTVIRDYFLANNFRKVDINSMKKHDILEIRMPNTKFPTHLAIYLDDNKILHHLHEFSKIESFANRYKRLTTAVYRHNTL